MLRSFSYYSHALLILGTFCPLLARRQRFPVLFSGSAESTRSVTRVTSQNLLIPHYLSRIPLLPPHQAVWVHACVCGVCDVPEECGTPVAKIRRKNSHFHTLHTLELSRASFGDLMLANREPGPSPDIIDLLFSAVASILQCMQSCRSIVVVESQMKT